MPARWAGILVSVSHKRDSVYATIYLVPTQNESLIHCVATRSQSDFSWLGCPRNLAALPRASREGAALHQRKGFAVAPPLFCPYGGVGPSTLGLGPSSAFAAERLCSHLYPCGRRALPATRAVAPLSLRDFADIRNYEFCTNIQIRIFVFDLYIRISAVVRQKRNNGLMSRLSSPPKAGLSLDLPTILLYHVFSKRKGPPYMRGPWESWKHEKSGL